MFGNKNENTKNEEVSSPGMTTHIAKGTLLEGNIETGGSIRIEGKIVGNVKTKSKVSQGDTSVIEGNVISQNAEIAGEVKGTVEISDLLLLKATAVVKGDIVTNKLVVESGAVWNGNCKMGAITKEIKLNDTSERKPEQQPARQPEKQFQKEPV